MPNSERERKLDELHSAALQRDASERDEFLRHKFDAAAGSQRNGRSERVPIR
jgi:hypothetical protein